MRLILLCLACIFVSSINSGLLQERKWSYTVKSFSAESEDETKIKIDIKAKRVSRSNYSLSGTVTVSTDVSSAEIEAKMFFSSSGAGQYKEIPYKVDRKGFYEFMNAEYKDILMKDFSKCSDFPVATEKFEPPFEQKTYTLNNCIMTADNLPLYVAEGYYKMTFTGWNPNFHGEVLVKVEKDVS